jgi:glycosyltransferase involved in cell wall biosynthesis
MRKVVLIYHSNICNKNCGINSYLYNIAKMLHEKGFYLDIFVPKSFDNNWDILEKGVVDNVFKKEIPTGFANNVKIGFLKKIFDKTPVIFRKITKRNARKIKNINTDKGKLDWIDEDDIERFKEVIKNNKYDYVLFSYIYYSKLLDYLPQNIMKVCSVSDFISIQQMQHGNYKFGEVIEEEIEAIKKFDEAVFISSDEMIFFSNFINNVKFSYLPHFISVGERENNIKDIDILFLGSDNEHNVRGINWFLENIFPKIKRKGYKIVIAGKVSTKINKNKYPNITFFNHVDDLDLLYSKVKIVIVPLLSGTGIKIKIIEAMSYYVPIVCTSMSVVGLMEKTDNGCIIANTADEFAKSIDSLLADENLRKALSLQAKNQCEKYYNEEYSRKILDAMFK